MEDDILHFPEGVHEDDVVGTGLVGMVALREERKTATSVSNRIWQFAGEGCTIPISSDRIAFKGPRRSWHQRS